ncbi:MAG TPA: methyltransferase domain-containing protein [Alphaproteobacteria bacterium]|nr:methyltransferase domain-containing protein [Alphaproteobacteria bacterium]
MDAIAYILQAQESWFVRIKPYLLDANLNVGSGHGFFTDIARKAGVAMTSLEVAVPDGALHPEEVILYDGAAMPFADRAYDVSLAMYVLHHSPSPEALLAEMRRVSARRIVLVEELYRHFPGKLRLAALDFWVNFRAGLKSRIHWNSYLDQTRLLQAVERDGWRLVYRHATPKAGFDEVLWVVEAAR